MRTVPDHAEEGIRDFWAVYQLHAAELSDATYVAVSAHPELGVLMSAIDPDTLRAQQAHGHALMQQAMQGDWEPYAANLRRQGATYANLGISFSGWHDITRVLGKLLVPILTETYADDPSRLAEALGGMYALLDFTVMVLGDAYLAAKERLVLESEARQSSILDSALDCIVCMDHRGIVTEFNPAAERTFGHTRAYAIGRSLGELIVPPVYREAHHMGLKHYLSSGEGPILGKRIELTAMRADGSLFPVEVAVSRTTVNGQEAFTGFIRDLTASREAERALHQTAEQNQRLVEEAAQALQRQRADAKFRGLLESAPDAMIIVDEDGEIVLVNVEAERLFGYSRAELLGQRADILIPARFHEQRTITFFLDLSPHDPNVELYAVRKDGAEFPIEISLSPLDTEDGMLVSSAIRDISERRDAELAREELAHALTIRAAELEAVNRELESFSYSVSHDLRGPLRALDGFSRALLKTADSKLDDAEKEYLRRIRSASQRMGRLIDDLLNLARITRTDVSMERVDLTALANQVIADLREAKPERTVEVSIAPGLSAYGDAALLEIALQNLLGNAWKFTERTQHAKIELQVADGVFSVRDNGAGFDMAYSNKLFNVFQRLHSSEYFDGTGIGLATVKRIVMRHGGHIWAEGEVGKGASFFFTIHRSEAA